jgi:protein-tyrosine phosphatase
VTERRLLWDGCLNVRDLGGHQTEDGGETRYRAVVRADSVRQLTDAGWSALVGYGIRTIVDLRRQSELDEDPPDELRVKVVHVPFVTDSEEERQLVVAERWLAAPDEASAVRDGYLEMLDTYCANVAAAVAVVGRAPEGGVLVHCLGGKDRTGLVAALLLRLAGVGIADIAADYGVSAEYLRPMLDGWIAGAGDAGEREFRRRLSASPPEAMAHVLEELERRHGSVAAYLLSCGASEADLERARARLRR